jgi:hypothetical protein
MLYPLAKIKTGLPVGAGPVCHTCAAYLDAGALDLVAVAGDLLAFAGAVLLVLAAAVVFALVDILALDFAAGAVVDACALAPSVMMAAANTSARLLKLFIV